MSQLGVPWYSFSTLWSFSALLTCPCTVLPNERRTLASVVPNDAKRAPPLMRSESVITPGAFVEIPKIEAEGDARSPALMQLKNTTKPYVVQIFYGSLDEIAMRVLGDHDCGVYVRSEYKNSPWRFDLIPYGKTVKDASNQTAFEHGEEEGKGNTVHQCALEYMDKEHALALIGCLMSKDMIRSAQAEAAASVTSGHHAPAGTYTYPVAMPTRPTVHSVVSNYEQQVQDACVNAKFFEERSWKPLLDNCTHDSVTRGRLERHYREATERKLAEIDGQFPAVFVNGTLRHPTGSGPGLCAYLN